ncbi:MAG: hypothetical protein AAF750_17550, partial [Planctomycetota bacterium]
MKRFLMVSAVAGAIALPSVAQTRVVLDTDVQRVIGGVGELDRARYFTQTETLLPNTSGGVAELLSPSGINVVSGRISTEFDQLISSGLPEDSTRPGFIDPTALRNRLRGGYRDFVTTGDRYAVIRSRSDALMVQSGRFNAFWPGYFIDPGTGGLPRADAYAEFINIYLDEVVYGADAFYPVSPERFYVELVNEPDLHFNNTLTRQALVDWHREVAKAVLAEHPEAKIGGPSLAVTSFEANEFGSGNDFSRFDERLGGLIADRQNSGLAYYSFHPYERYDVDSNDELSRGVDNSPGRTSGLLDLVRARDLAENPGEVPLPIALTEYGSFNRFIGDPAAAGYTRQEMQFDLSRDIREQLLVYLARPDVVLNATPFVQGAPIGGTGGVTEIEQDNVLFEVLAGSGGSVAESYLAQTFRAYANVKGQYIDLSNAAPGDLQAIAFRDGDEVYVLLNNLLDTSQVVDLGVLTAAGGVVSATADRLFQSGELSDAAGGQSVYLNDVDVLGGLSAFQLNPNEGAVITLKLSEDMAISRQLDVETYYSLETVNAFGLGNGQTSPFTIDAEVDAETLREAVLRLTYTREDANLDLGETFEVIVNGTRLRVPAGVLGIDDGDTGLQQRELVIDPALLLDGENTFVVDFLVSPNLGGGGDGGALAAAALVLTHVRPVPEPALGSVLVLGGLLMGRRGWGRRRAAARRGGDGVGFGVECGCVGVAGGEGEGEGGGGGCCEPGG